MMIPAPGRRALLASLAGSAWARSEDVAATSIRPDSPEAVDLLLVLAVDVSSSVTDAEARLQRDGYRAALCHEDVLSLIRSGPSEAIGLAYVQWAGLEYQRLILPWTRIGDSADAIAWGERMERAARAAQGEAEAAAFPNSPVTSISAGLRMAASVLRDAPWPAVRRVIDISGDGPNNDGLPAEAARDAVVAEGVTINGLAIEGDPDVARELGEGASLEAYYRASVIGGPGAFVEPVLGAGSFAGAIRRKMVREIADLAVPATRAG
ncbi:DUF1194 domain-containing protein [Roseomonas sp. HF4]|uniref:DUF1194 domain-containing protein n=1 Tax=Roseomonas sp. HF4 TaxID=2562313 RepID=UPI001F0F8E1F|nr:DUF1194 domain-containing protein [Roseomonas sp. HF4]